MIMRKFSKKAQHFAMLICGIICVANIFIACNKNDDDYTETDEVTKRLTHFSISSNRADYDYDNATFYYEYDELDRIVAVKGQTTFQFSYIGDSNVPENLRIIENTNRPNRYEDHKVIYNENGIPVQVQSLMGQIFYNRYRYFLSDYRPKLLQILRPESLLCPADFDHLL